MYKFQAVSDMANFAVGDRQNSLKYVLSSLERALDQGSTELFHQQSAKLKCPGKKKKTTTR